MSYHKHDGGGGLEPKIMEDFYQSRKPRIYEKTAPTIRSEREGLKVIEPIIYDDYNGRIKADQSTDGTLTTNCGESADRCGLKIIEPTIWGSKQEHCAKRTDGICPTLTEAMGMGGGQTPLHNYDARIRKLTPVECWRLMDFTDKDFYYAAYGREVPVELAKRVELRNLTKAEWKVLWRYERHQQVSNSQLYKQAGNSIVVAVLQAIFGKML